LFFKFNKNLLEKKNALKNNLTFTIIILLLAVATSIFLWSIGVYFFFLPIIFLPFLRFVRLSSNQSKSRICHICGLQSDGSYCSRCGTKL